MQNVEQFYQLIDNGQISEANAFFTGIYNHLKPALEKRIIDRVGIKAFTNIGDDILQTVFTNIHKQLSNPKRRWIRGKVINGRIATFESWASSFVKFKSIDVSRKEKRHHRKRKEFEFAKVDKASSDLGPLDILAYEDFKNRVFGQIGKLPELPKKMMIRSIEGYNGVEIARDLNITGVEVSRNLQRARNLLLESKTF
jgi:DNA-directed RNA polymerase specialized sigma24 family protein